MKKQPLFLSLFTLLLVFTACQKEFSAETGGTLSQGTLQSDLTGDCLPKTVAGAYEEGVAVDGALNYIEVEVNVITAGSYVIGTDTVNGIYFRATGVFTSTGSVLVKLPAKGTPVTAGIQNFIVRYGTSQCAVAVTTLPPGGAGPAEITLISTGGTCGNFDLLGTYTTGTPLNSSNQVVLNVNVDVIGTYSITTVTSNGIFFTGSGSVGTPGPTTITLTGNGTPVITGPTNVPVTIGVSACSFTIDVVGPSVYTIDCGSAVISGQYTVGVDLDGTNFVTILVDVTTAGGYNISGNINGMTFSAAGDFANAGQDQPVTLTGSGIPTAEGTFGVMLNMGATPCSFDVVCDAAGTGGTSGTWQFTEGGTTYSGTISDAIFDNTTAAPLVIFFFVGTTATGEIFELDIADLDGTFDQETYSGNATTLQNICGVYFENNTNVLYQADPSILPNTLTVGVTSHTVSTKTITGVFSGNVQDENGNVKTITNGTFSVTYP